MALPAARAGVGPLIHPAGGPMAGCCCVECSLCNTGTAPAQYDASTSGVSSCGFAPITSTAERMDFVESGSASWCQWRKNIADPYEAMSFGIDPGGASFGHHAGAFAFFFNSDVLPYGPDCSESKSFSNIYTDPDDCGGLQAGYGGTAIVTPVLPP